MRPRYGHALPGDRGWEGSRLEDSSGLRITLPWVSLFNSLYIYIYVNWDNPKKQKINKVERFKKMKFIYIYTYNIIFTYI